LIFALLRSFFATKAWKTRRFSRFPMPAQASALCTGTSQEICREGVARYISANWRVRSERKQRFFAAFGGRLGGVVRHCRTSSPRRVPSNQEWHPVHLYPRPAKEPFAVPRLQRVAGFRLSKIVLFAGSPSEQRLSWRASSGKFSASLTVRQEDAAYGAGRQAHWAFCQHIVHNCT
jgi:hypothetical protein